MNDQINKFRDEAKSEEKGTEKKGNDTLSSLAWALILIWAGLVFLAVNMGWLDQIQFQQILPEGLDFFGLSSWSLIFLGAGTILLIEAVIRTFVPAYRSSSGGNYFLAAIFLGIGLSGIFGWEIVWPIVLIALGLSTLANSIIRNRN